MKMFEFCIANVRVGESDPYNEFEGKLKFGGINFAILV